MISAVCAVPRGACAPQPRAAKGGAADSDAEDDAVRASDAVFLAGRTEDDFSCVEMYVYDDEQGSLYVHHDVRLEAFPLALAFLQHGSAGARVAVGTMEPRIDVWDLDVMEPAAPVASLGGDAPTAAGRKAPRPTPGAHGDAVLSVSWRRHSPTVLASGSADRTVKLWDLNARACAVTWTHHGDRVSSVAWHPAEPACLATGGHDGRLAVRDARRATAGATFAAGGRVEQVAWDPFVATTLVAGDETGGVVAFDVRAAAAPLWSLRAHGAAASAVCFSETAAGLLATASADASVKLWDCGGAPGPPAPVAARDLAVGELFALAFDAADPLVLVAAGAGGSVALWDAAGDDGAAAAWLAAQG